MVNPFTYMAGRIRAYPVSSTLVTAAASLFIGWTGSNLNNYLTRVPEAKLGILTVDTTIGDKNGDNIPDAMAMREDGYAHFVVGNGDGTFTGIEGVARQYQDIEKSLNHSSTSKARIVPPVRPIPANPTQPPASTPQSTQPTPTQPPANPTGPRLSPGSTTYTGQEQYKLSDNNVSMAQGGLEQRTEQNDSLRLVPVTRPSY